MLKHKSYVIIDKKALHLKIILYYFCVSWLYMLLFSVSTSEIMCQFFCYFSLHRLPLISHLGVIVSPRELREHIQDSMASSEIVIQRDLSYLVHLPLLWEIMAWLPFQVRGWLLELSYMKIVFSKIRFSQA